MTESLPATAVVRVSRATFDPGRFAEVDAMNTKTSKYLIPAIQRLPGLIHFYAGVSPQLGHLTKDRIHLEQVVAYCAVAAGRS